MVAAELQMNQLITTMMAMFTPVVSFLGLSLSSVIPDIPGLGINIMDLISGNIAGAIQGVKDKIIELGSGVTSLWPSITLPWNQTLSIPDFEILQIVQTIVRDYTAGLMGILAGLIGDVVDELEIASMAALPMYPTKDQIMSGLELLTGTHDTLGLIEIIRATPELMKSAFDGVVATFGGTFSFSWPSVYMPDISCVEHEIQEGVKNVLGAGMTGLLQHVMDFIDSTLGSYLSFNFPLLCIPLPDSIIPA
jgi:hypothetical protein